MGTQITWSDIKAFVAEVMQKEGARPNKTLYDMLGRQALNIISEAVEPYETSWDDTGVSPDLTVSGNTVTLPIDCLSVRSVEWDDIVLVRKTAEWLDEKIEGWREDSGESPNYYIVEGNTVVFDVAPSGTGVVVRGVSALPDFSDDGSDPNPLTYLPVTQQLAPAYYILANLPAKPKGFIRDDMGRIVGTDNSEIERQKSYRAMWEAAIAGMVGSVLARKHPAYSGR